ncbi:MAG: LLM class flavin-dependent oxidoreductase [Candidatus Hodarchaeota archaeon]
MKYGINIQNYGIVSTPDEMADLAVMAEEAGWDGFFIWDHLIITPQLFDFPFVDPIVTLATMAMKTSRIQIGTLITPLPRRRPWKVAREMVSIDHLAKGRLILGVGLGTPDYEYLAFGEELNNNVRAKKLDEGLAILLGLWSGEKFSYTGEFYQLQEIKFTPKPYNGTIPIIIGGMWPNKKPFQRAAQFDGVCPVSAKWPEILTPQDLKGVVECVKAYRQNLDHYEVMIAGATPTDLEEGIQIVQPYVDEGATWWVEDLHDMRGWTDEMKERIQAGPPK